MTTKTWACKLFARKPVRPIVRPRSALRLEELEERRVPAFDFGFAGPVQPGGMAPPFRFATGDINGDGMNDLVNTETFSGTLVHVFLGNGRGGFSEQAGLDSAGGKGDIALADVNRDGKLDLLYTGRNDGTLRTRFGNGDGTFGAESVRAQLGPASNSLLNTLKLADINGDGFLDAVGGSANAGVRIAYDDGTGTFALATSSFDGLGGVNDFVVIDATNDGAPDVIYTSLSGHDLGVVSGLRTTPVVNGTNLLGGLSSGTRLAVAQGPSGLVFAITEFSGRVVVGRNPAAPANVTQMPGTYESLSNPAIADFDGNGVLDLGFAAMLNPPSFTGTLHVVAGAASGVPFAGGATTYVNGLNCTGVFPAQLDADGTTDIVVVQIGGSGGSGNFQNLNAWLNRQQSLVVSTTADENDGNASWASGTGTSLREALAYAANLAAPGPITFAPFLGYANSVVTLNSEVRAGSSLTFNPIVIRNERGSVTLNGRGQNRIFTVGFLDNLTVENLNFAGGNAGTGTGGAIAVGTAGRLTVNNCAFFGNAGDGAAIFGDSVSTIDVRNSTFANNTGGAAIRSVGNTLNLLNCTVSGNAAGVSVAGPTTVLRNTIFANSTAGADLTIVGTASGSNNIVRTGDTTGLTGTINADPLLNALANNGGPTRTMSQKLGSPAFNAGTADGSVTTDQRGIVRPQHGAPDIGAFETRVGVMPTLNPNTLTVYNNGSPINLALATNPNPAGGTFTGEGVSNGVFNPGGMSAGPRLITYVDPASPTIDLYPLATLTINVLAAPALNSADVSVQPAAGSVSEGQSLTVNVVISNIRDQYGNPFVPTAGSVSLFVGGTSLGTVNLTAAQLSQPTIVVSFAVPFPDDDPSGTPSDVYQLNASVQLNAFSTTASSPVTVNNVAPSNLQLGGPTTVSHGVAFTLTGSFADPGLADTHAVTIDWHDGTPNTMLNLPLGTRTFSADHTYATQAGAPTVYNVVVTVADDDTGGVAAQPTVNVIRYNESLVVTTTVDEDNGTSDATFGTGTSLREAIKYAESHAGPDTITFAPSLAGQTVTLSQAWGNADGFQLSTALIVSGELTIRGPAAGAGVTLLVDAAARRRHLLVAGASSLALENLTLTGGDPGLSGFGYGGAVQSFGSLTARNCTFVGNNAPNDGGAIHSAGNSQVLSLVNCTFAGNTSPTASAVATVAASNTWDHLTVVDNAAGTGGGAFDIFQTSVTMRNSVVARNINGGAITNLGNNTGTFSTASTNNLVGTGSWRGLNPASNRLGVAGPALLMGTLAGNGGPTQTVALLPGSPAVNAGVSIAGITADQRGVARDVQPDVGSLEFTDFAPQFQVTTTADEDDGTADPRFGTGTSLREALRYAEQHAGPDTVTFAPSLGGQTVMLSAGWNGASDSAALRVGTDITIQGLATAPGVTISMASGVQKRHLLVEDNASVTVDGLTFTNGTADFGGSIRNFGSLTVRGCTFTGNSASSDGGAIHSAVGSQSLTLENSTFAGNTSPLASALTTAAANNLWDHVTVVDNTAGTGGGAFDIYQTVVTLRNSIVARNTNDGAITNLGTGTGTFSAASVNNLLGSGGWTGLTDGVGGNRLGVSAAQLNAGVLAYNGGSTPTVALLPGSHAIDMGSNPTGLAFDQRGNGFPRVFGPATDIGAFELQSTPPPAPHVTGVAVNTGQANTAQRSRVTSITVTFDAEVTFAGNVGEAFTVSRIGGTAVGGFAATAEVVNGVTVVTLGGFTGAETEFGSLADGRFAVAVQAYRVFVGGVRLDGDGNGLGGDDYVLSGTVANGLFRLFGDADGDGTVNAADYGGFRPTLGSSSGQSAYLDWLDIDGDGVINAFDYGRFRNRYGASVP